MQKVGNYGKLDLWEIAYNKEDVVDISYESDSAWQSAEPTATGSSAVNYRSSAFKFDGKEVIIGDNYNNATTILTTGQIRSGSLTGQSAMLNPNGSLDSIAGIFNDNKNILGMMPHPERMVDEIISNKDGVNLFSSLFN